MVPAEAEAGDVRSTSGPARRCPESARRGGSQVRSTGFHDGQPLKSAGAPGRLGFGDNGDVGTQASRTKVAAGGNRLPTGQSSGFRGGPRGSITRELARGAKSRASPQTPR